MKSQRSWMLRSMQSTLFSVERRCCKRGSTKAKKSRSRLKMSNRTLSRSFWSKNNIFLQKTSILLHVITTQSEFMKVLNQSYLWVRTINFRWWFANIKNLITGKCEGSMSNELRNLDSVLKSSVKFFMIFETSIAQLGEKLQVPL